MHAAAVIVHDETVLLAHRPSAGLLGGLWEFPNAAVGADPALDLAPAIEAGYGLKLRPGAALGILRHTYTHFKLVEHVFACEVQAVPSGLTWTPITALQDHPMGKVDRWIAGSMLAKTADT